MYVAVMVSLWQVEARVISSSCLVTMTDPYPEMRKAVVRAPGQPRCEGEGHAPSNGLV